MSKETGSSSLWPRYEAELSAKKAAAALPEERILTTFEITDHEISISSFEGTKRLSWDGILRVVRCSRGYLLYLSESEYLWLTMESFESPDTRDLFDAIQRRCMSR